MVGTGTGVGKTTVSCRLAAAARAAGHPVLALKPVETGGVADARLLAEAAGREPTCPAPYAFSEPISPHLAARRSGVDIVLSNIFQWIDVQERCACDGEQETWTLIETAGGAFTPLALGATNVDLLRGLGAARVVLVAPDQLGVLHAVTATWLAMRSVFRAPDLVVLTQAPPADQSTGTNLEELRALPLHLPVLLDRDPTLLERVGPG